MLKQTAKMLEDYSHSLSKKVPALKQDIEEFAIRINGLTELEAEIKQGTTISVSHKKSGRKYLVTALLRLTASLRRSGYRNVQGRTEKEKRVRFTVSDLGRMKESTLGLLSLEIIEAAKQLEQPGHFGLKPGDVGHAERYRNSFIAQQKETDRIRKDRTEKNKLLNEGIKESVFILTDTIDPLMSIACEDDDKLTRTYKGYREVLPKGQGRPSDVEISYRKTRARKSSGKRKTDIRMFA